MTCSECANETSVLFYPRTINKPRPKSHRVCQMCLSNEPLDSQYSIRRGFDLVWTGSCPSVPMTRKDF
jgi:hypothetical protein